jgi:general secretion pathway protein I
METQMTITYARWPRSCARHAASHSDRKGLDRQGGFTLIEVLIAFVILVVTLTAMSRAFSVGLHDIGTAERFRMATMLARSVLDEVGVEIPLVEGQQSDIARDGFTWTTRVVINTALAKNIGAGLGQIPYDVEVDVSWGGNSLLTLTTLRIAPTRVDIGRGLQAVLP